MRVPETPVGRWLEESLRGLQLGEEAEGYLYGRAFSEELVGRLGVGEWRLPANPVPHQGFARRYGDRGERVEGFLAFPIRAPGGRLLGVEFRSWREKVIYEFRTPESEWNPFLINAPRAMERMAEGGSVWVVEGVYDLAALEWAVPPGDAVLSTLRAGFSRSTVEFLARWCQNRVYMVYDNDDTGRRATRGWVDKTTGKPRLGALELMRRAGVTAVDFRYRGKDPGEVWRAGGARAMREEFAGLPTLG